MKKALKNIGFFFVTIALTAFIFWLVFLDKESKNDVLEYSLTLLGDKLMAMVPDNSDKSSVKNLYDNFVKQAAAKEVAPEQVEYVAANIFNLSNLDTTLSAEQAEAVLKYSLEAPLKLERIEDQLKDSMVISEKISDNRLLGVVAEKNVHPEKWENLGLRIQELNNVNDELKRAMKEHAHEMREKHLQMHYRIDKGLRVTIDPRLKEKFKNKKYSRLSRELRKMEENELLEWRKDFRKEMEQMRHELHDLRKLKRLEELEKLKELKTLGSMEAFKALEGLEFVPPVINADSIQAIVNKSLEKAGIINNDSL